MENFGTWRDAKGRLAWGVNDFDEAATLPYTNDLVRLATSASLASEAARLGLRQDLAGAFLDAYATRLRKGGWPIVLAERNARIGESILRATSSDCVPSGRRRWRTSTPRPGRYPQPVGTLWTARAAARHGRGERLLKGRGRGSLGRSRFVALRRSGTAVSSLARRRRSCRPPRSGLPVPNRRGPEHSRPPSPRIDKQPRPVPPKSREGWVVRRLAPDSDKIEIARLGRASEIQLAALMGHEVANVHLRRPGHRTRSWRTSRRGPAGWLVKAARTMASSRKRVTERGRKTDAAPRRSTRDGDAATITALRLACREGGVDVIYVSLAAR